MHKQHSALIITYTDRINSSVAKDINELAKRL